MKTTRFSLLAFLLPLLFVTHACQSASPKLKEFRPEDDSLFRITFSYPASWDWKLDGNTGVTYTGMTAREPYPAGEGITEKSRLTGIDVTIETRAQEKMQEQITSHLEGIEYSGTRDLLEDKTLTIDGHYARWLTLINTLERTNPGVNYIQEFIYLLAEDRYYTITLYIPENEVDGRFHKEFKALVESIQFLP